MRYLFLVIIAIAGCTVEQKAPPIIESKPVIEAPAPPPANAPTPKPQEPAAGGTVRDARAEIFKIADGSKCSKRAWPGRGTAKSAYYRGMALAYYRAFCAGQMAPNKPASPRDALVLYDLPASLRATYTLLVGLGMRESSGRYCVGLDITNATSRKHDTCESGSFQVSYNSRTAGTMNVNPELMAIYNKWRGKSGADCDLDVWSKDVTCSADNWKYYGEGPGVEFQKLMKNCPAFAAEYTALGIRLVRNHWGPIINKAVEYNKDCEEMFSLVEKVGC